ncbi:hypothetical protein P7C70_g1122, partial [Phenoliferia sp. Uapishka_3]
MRFASRSSTTISLVSISKNLAKRPYSILSMSAPKAPPRRPTRANPRKRVHSASLKKRIPVSTLITYQFHLSPSPYVISYKLGWTLDKIVDHFFKENTHLGSEWRAGIKDSVKLDLLPAMKAIRSGVEVTSAFFPLRYRSGTWKTQENFLEHLRGLDGAEAEGLSKLTQPTFSKWVKDITVQSTEEEQEKTKLMGVKVIREREVRYPALVEALVAWMNKRDALGQQVSAPLLRVKALRFCNKLEIPEKGFKASFGWASKFLKRNGFGLMRRHGESASASSEDVEAEQGGNGTFTYSRQDKASGTKADKTRLSVLCTISASGERFPLLFIGKYASPRPFKRRTPKQLEIDYHSNAKVWVHPTDNSRSVKEQYKIPSPSLTSSTDVRSFFRLCRKVIVVYAPFLVLES